MDLHWIAGVVVLLAIAVVSAYREAGEREGAMRFSAMRDERRRAREKQP
jgi:hypothetical protein